MDATRRLILIAAVIVGLVLLVVLARSPGRPPAAGAQPDPDEASADFPSAPASGDAGSSPEASVEEDDLAIAYGFLLDSPRPKEVVEEGLRIAELLRQRYAIDTGNRYQDRLAAAHRAKREFVDRLVFSEEEVERMASSLGHSLNPEECADFCPQVRRLCIFELQKEALRAFAEGREGPGRIELE